MRWCGFDASLPYLLTKDFPSDRHSSIGPNLPTKKKFEKVLAV